MGDQPLVRWDWIIDNIGDPIGTRLLEHLQLSLTPILLGLLIALPVGIACARWRSLYPPVFTGVNVIYAIPSIALFFLLLPYTSFSPWTAIIPLALYTLAILVPNVVDGLNQVPDHVRQAATAMGFGPLRRLVQVELPVAVPVIIAGLRIAAVATISMVSIASLVGLGGLGQLILTDGFRRQFSTPIVVGIVLSVVLAFLVDGLLVLLQRRLTPWTRGRELGAAARTAAPASARDRGAARTHRGAAVAEPGGPGPDADATGGQGEST
ncbi:osmoprotectant transport system permease protein [Spinactinospora alkalitolerans]|uniref:Osmoprotectant transport system permease protein n=1 Tax=Spinactinospora alkalitolerans TaxID=687207 RepID=A0A852TRA0_9ACTN|nr:ABC transporter permease [Spinactinospora alkalitolerans]NYE45827.1 osmoprotectant transport system permease protein [Spinactinospora alkalitolerans]